MLEAYTLIRADVYALGRGVGLGDGKRTDRYPELRSAETVKLQKIEMSYMWAAERPNAVAFHGHAQRLRPSASWPDAVTEMWSALAMTWPAEATR